MPHKVQSMIDNNQVMIFSKDSCLFCKKAKGILEEMNVEYRAVELDLLPHGPHMQSALIQITNQQTVPCIYINKEKLGGCDQLIAAKKSQKLYSMLEAAGVAYNAS